MRQAILLLLIVGGTLLYFAFQQFTQLNNSDDITVSRTIEDHTSPFNGTGGKINEKHSTGQTAQAKQKTTPTYSNSTIEKTETLKDFVSVVYPKAIVKRPTPKLQTDPAEIAIEDPFLDLIQISKNPPQHFSLDASEGGVVTAKAGSLLAIPEHCFINPETKEPINGEVFIEVKECTNTSDLLLAGVNTSSPYAYYTTDAVIYIQATHEGKAVDIAYDKRIYIELPTKEQKADGRLFHGQKTDVKDEMQWYKNNRPPSNKLLTLPLSVFDWEGMGLDAQLSKKLSDKTLEQTLIATRAFEERLALIISTKEIHENRTPPILDFFLKNLHKELHQIDTKLAYYFKSLLEVQPYQNGEKVAEIEALSQQFSKFAEQGLGHPVNFSPYGINIADAEAPNKMRQYLGSQKANELMHLYQLRANLIENRTNKKSKSKTKKRKDRYCLFVNKTGWMAVSRPAKVKGSKRQRIEVETTGLTQAEHALKVFLVFKEAAVIIQAQPNKRGKYVFNQLPDGAQAHIVALSSTNGQPYYDIAQIKIGDQPKLKLQLRPTTPEQLHYQLAQLNH